MIKVRIGEKIGSTSEAAVFLKGLIGIIVTAIVVWLLIGLWSIIIIPIITFGVLYLYWAKHDVFGTFPDEGRDVVLFQGGEYYKELVQCRGYDIDVNGDIGKSDPTNLSYIGPSRKYKIWGMSVFLWPIRRVHEFDIEYSVVSTEEGVHQETKRETIRQILIAYYNKYSIRVEKIETKDNTTIDIYVTVVARTFNIVKAMIKNKRWLPYLTSKVESYFRVFGSDKDFNEIKAVKDIQSISEEAKTEMQKVISTLSSDYGIKVKEIIVREVVFSSKQDEDNWKKEITAKKTGEANLILSEYASKGNAQEVAGVFMQQLVIFTGKTIEALQKEYNANPQQFEANHKSAIERAHDAMIRYMETKGKTLNDIRIVGGGVGGDLTTAATVYSLLGGSKNPDKGSTNTTDEKKNLSKEDITKKWIEELGLDEY